MTFKDKASAIKDLIQTLVLRNKQMLRVAYGSQHRNNKSLAVTRLQNSIHNRMDI
jgi:hypothetical protein